MNGVPSQPRRRKKRPVHGLKTVDVSRGKSGYGFTISGQHPCVLSCIINNSPADRVGLRPGDYLMSVNGIDVSKHSHDDVVCMVGTSTGTLTIQVAENYNSSDSSDDEYYHRTKAKYPHRSRRSAREHHMGYGDKMEKLLTEINQRSRHIPEGMSHQPTSRPVGKNEDGKYDLPKPRSSRDSRQRVHLPVGAENNEIQADGTSYIEAGASNVFKVPFQKSASTSQVPSAASAAKMHHYGEAKQAFIKSTSQSHVKPAASGGNAFPPRSFPPSHQQHGHMYDQFSPNSLQQIINHSLHSYSAANEAFILNEDDIEEEDEGPIQPEGGEVKIIVGYVGSLEMPGNANQPHVRIQSIRNAVRRLRVEQKIHTLVLMVVTPDFGVRLLNTSGQQIAFYPVDRLAFSGVCPDDRRFFGIVTLHSSFSDTESDSDSGGEIVGSSCHVFMVDQELIAHNMHAQKARTFNIECHMDPNTQLCQEFPRSTTPIILSISNLYKDRPSGPGMDDMERSQVFANPNRPVEHVRTSSSSSSHSNSDSGVGLCREDDRGAVGDAPPPVPARTRPPPPQLPTVKWSGNTMYLTDGPIRNSTRSPGRGQQGSPNSKQNSSNPADLDKLNVRAMPDSPASRSRSAGDGLDNQNAAENLRIGMQKLLQARQKTSSEQPSSDFESFGNQNEQSLSTSDLTDRPLSAPFKYLSDESQSESKRSKGSFRHVRQHSDSNMADKLSPRAFVSPGATTPTRSSRSGARQKTSKSRLHEKRSPSAPPLPSYHGDDEDSDGDMSGLIRRLQKDKILGTTTDSIELRKMDISAMIKERDQERRGVSSPVGSPELSPKNGLHGSLDKWSSPVGKGGSLKQKGLRRNPLSLSHESLVVLDQDPHQMKLTSASSVNSVMVAAETEQGGRVAGWAVSFHRLLADNIGITVFTDFLKKEFSEENIEFWRMCENYKNLADANLRKSKAREIYDKHVSMKSSAPVNIDSVTRKEVESHLDNPSPQIFVPAQHHIFQLMKQDSYSRFLKSELYKSYVVREMEGRPISVPGTVDANTLLDRDAGGKKKGGKENNEEQKEKRRRSLLPWRLTKNKKSKEEKNQKSNKGDNQDKEKQLETKDSNMNNLPLTANAPTTIDTVASKRTQAELEVPATIEEEPDQPRFCRVIMPDGSTTVVGTKQGQTVKHVLGKLCEKRGLSIASVDVFLLGSDKLLNLNEDISTLGSKEVTIERRVLFRIDLPNKKCIGVKAKPNRHIRDVFKPILQKYGFKMEDIDVHLIGQPEFLCLDDLVSTIDSQRVIVVANPSELPESTSVKPGVNSATRPPRPNKYSSKHGLLINPKEKPINPKDRLTNHNPTTTTTNNNYDGLTNQIFGSLMLDKSDQFLAHNFDELGILDGDFRDGKVETVELVDTAPSPCTENTAEGAGTGNPRRSKQRVTFALQKNTVRNRPASEDGDRRDHTLSLDEQRVHLSQEQIHNLEHGRNKTVDSRDLMSEIDDYIESINENFAAYTRESVGTPNRSLVHAGETPKSALKSSNKSFSEDSVVPTNEDAEKLFQSSNTADADFSDPYLTEKSLTDIGFNYSHNKYLARSRNFINQRKAAKHVSPVCVQLTKQSRSKENSPNRTLTSLADQSLDLLDATVINSPQSSPYSSDSSLEKENKVKSQPRSKTRVRSRHTVIHSPSASDSGDNFLSTVDTDGNFVHATPVRVTVTNAGSTPKTLDYQNLSTSEGSTDEVTFV